MRNMSSVQSVNQQDLSNGRPKISESSRNSAENSNGKDEQGSSHSVSNVSITEAQRCMSLYFALCTKVLNFLLSLKYELARLDDAQLYMFYNMFSIWVLNIEWSFM